MSNINDFGMPFTSQAGDRAYSAMDWRSYFSALLESGIIGNIDNELKVNPQTTPNKTVYVDTGTIFISGAMRVMTTVTNISLADNASGQPRVDRIVARLNYTNRLVEFAVLQGTPAVSPMAPNLTRNTAYFEIALADITLVNGYTTITAAIITDQRGNETVCGYFKYKAKPAWYPSIGTPARDAWMYTNFKSQLTTQEKMDIEANSSLMAIINTGNEADNKKQSEVVPRYLTLVANSNADARDSALGKNGLDSEIYGVGEALARYAWYKGESRVSQPLANLRTKQKISEIDANAAAKSELLNNSSLNLLAVSSPYVYSQIHVPSVVPFNAGADDANYIFGVFGAYANLSAPVYTKGTTLYLAPANAGGGGSTSYYSYACAEIQVAQYFHYRPTIRITIDALDWLLSGVGRVWLYTANSYNLSHVSNGLTSPANTTWAYSITAPGTYDIPITNLTLGVVGIMAYTGHKWDGTTGWTSSEARCRVSRVELLGR